MNILRLLKQGSKTYLLGAIAAGVASGLLLTFLIQMIHRAMVLEAPDPVRFIGFYMLVWFVFVICTTIATITTSGMAHKALYQLREWVTDHILRVSYRSTEGRASELFPVLTEDIQTISYTIYRIPAITTASATILGCVAYMFYLSWPITLVIMGLFVLIYITMTAFGRRAQHYARKARVQYDHIYHFFEDLVYGLKELKLNPSLRNHYRNTLFPPLIEVHQNYKLRENILFNFSIRSIEILFFPALGALVYAIFVYGVATPAAFSGVLTVLLFMLSPLSTVANFASDYKAMQISLQRVNNLEQQIGENLEMGQEQINLPDTRLTGADVSLSKADESSINSEMFATGPEESSKTDSDTALSEAPSSETDAFSIDTDGSSTNTDESSFKADAPSNKTDAKASKTDVSSSKSQPPILELVDITLSYTRDDGKQNFKMGPISVSIPERKITFIIGDNGSGKSTMAKVLTGLYAPDSGHLNYRGTRIEPQYLVSYRSRFSSVFSDFHLFRSLPPESLNNDSLQKWIDIMGLSNHVEINQDEISTEKLSQGQRERLAFAIACSYPSEILVLDEIASNQDVDFKHRIYHEILPMLRDQGKTIIVISHDQNYFRAADNTIRFQNGKVIA
jgi:putative pyoverdin transport system ATP-binding/permease protein